MCITSQKVPVRVHKSTLVRTESKVQTLGIDHFATAYFKEALSPFSKLASFNLATDTYCKRWESIYPSLASLL